VEEVHYRLHQQELMEQEEQVGVVMVGPLVEEMVQLIQVEEVEELIMDLQHQVDLVAQV
jgi:hypothetical protein